MGVTPHCLHHTGKVWLHFFRRLLSELNYIICLDSCQCRIAPWTSHHIQSFHCKVHWCFISPLIVPVANNYIFRYHLYSTICIIVARFPLSKSCSFTINQSIAPYPKATVLLCKMVADQSHFVCKQFCLIPPAAARAFIFT